MKKNPTIILVKEKREWTNVFLYHGFGTRGRENSDDMHIKLVWKRGEREGAMHMSLYKPKT